MLIRAVVRACVWWTMVHFAPSADSPGWSGRVVDQPCFHLGIRPATDALNLSDFAVTVQTTYCTPW